MLRWRLVETIGGHGEQVLEDLPRLVSTNPDLDVVPAQRPEREYLRQARRGHPCRAGGAVAYLDVLRAASAYLADEPGGRPGVQPVRIHHGEGTGELTSGGNP